MVMFPDDPNGAEKQRKVMEGANRFMDSLNKTKSNHKPTKQDQYSVEKRIDDALFKAGILHSPRKKAIPVVMGLLQAERREAVEEFIDILPGASQDCDCLTCQVVTAKYKALSKLKGDK